VCGIAGIVAPGGVSPVALERMSRALEHRGPDGEGYVLYGAGRPLSRTPRAGDRLGRETATVGLAHRRLAIIDLSTDSDQPMIDVSGRCALVYNGELYNYLEVRAELERRGHTFRTTGDTEVVLTAYLEWGPDCVQRFVGMWAFALLDVERRSLLLSRDRFGIKPLFYTVVRGELRFASEIKGLLATGDLDLEPNDDAVRHFMLIGRVDSSHESFFRGVFQLPPAHYAVITIDTPSIVRPQRYWALPAPGEAGDVPDAPEQLEALLRDSVRLHARSDVPVGTCLSGGLDSSAIVCEAQLLRERGEIPSFAHHGFGYVPQDVAYSERRHMDAVTQQTRLQMTYVNDDPERVLDVIPLIARQQDEPFGTASIVAQWFVFEAAARAGLKVMLDGQGADEVLGGYHAYLPIVARAHLRSWRLLRYARFAADHRRLVGTRPLARRDVLVSAVPAMRRLGDLRSRGLTPAAAMLSPAFRGDWHRADEGSLATRSINDILARATRMQLPALLRFEDRNSMAHSIEARVPFLDHRLVEFAFRLPGDQKIHGAVTKHVLREGLAGILPESVRARTDKIGFRADPGITWKFAARHRDVLLRSETRFEDRWFDRRALAQLVDSSDHSLDTEYALWRAISLKLWLAGNWSDRTDTLAA
jgi:asparagine synthase (glutamine-hydrolysing)